MANLKFGPEQVINKAFIVIGRLTLEKALAEDHIDHLEKTGVFPGDKETAEVIRQMGETEDGQPGDPAATE